MAKDRLHFYVHPSHVAHDSRHIVACGSAVEQLKHLQHLR
jgi:hypothetical protein